MASSSNTSDSSNLPGLSLPISSPASSLNQSESPLPSDSFLHNQQFSTAVATNSDLMSKQLLQSAPPVGISAIPSSIDALASRCHDLTIVQDVETAAFQIQIQPPAIQQTKPQEEFFLIGSVKALRVYSFKAVEKAMRNAWNPLFTVEMKEVEPNLYLFRFTNRLDINKVLRLGPWRFNDYLLATKETDPGTIVPREQLNSINFWIQVYGLPALWQTVEVMRYVGGLLGRVVDTDAIIYKQDGFGPTFMRVRVELRIDRKLPRGTNLEDRTRTPDNEPQVISLASKYERLYNFCYWCGVIDHILEECIETLQPGFDAANCGYGDWLKGIPPRTPVQPTYSGWNSDRIAPRGGNPFARPLGQALLPTPSRGLLPLPQQLASRALPEIQRNMQSPRDLAQEFRSSMSLNLKEQEPPKQKKRTYKKRDSQQKVLDSANYSGQQQSGSKKKRGAETDPQINQEAHFFEPVDQE